jgi:hypothetical protein
MTAGRSIEEDRGTSGRRGKIWIAAAGVFLLAVVTRACFLWYHGPVVVADAPEYLQIARNLVEHHAYSSSTEAPFLPTIRRAPLYQFLIAALNFWGEQSALRVVWLQIVLDALVAVEVLFLTRLVAPAPWAIVAGFFYAVYPGAIDVSYAVMNETLFTFVLTSAIGLLAWALPRDRTPGTMTSGILLGLAALCRPIALLYPLTLAAVILLRRGFPRRVLHSLLLVGCAATVIAPWSIRCSRLAGSTVLLQSNSVMNWYMATRWDWHVERWDPRQWDELAAADLYTQRFRAARTPREQVEADRFGAEQAWRNIAASPCNYLKSRLHLYPRLFVNSFDNITKVNKSFLSSIREGDLVSFSLKCFMLVVFSLLPFFLALAGLAAAGRSVIGLLSATVWVSTAIIHLPMWIEYRFWIPMMPFMLVSAAGVPALLARQSPLAHQDEAHHDDRPGARPRGTPAARSVSH